VLFVISGVLTKDQLIELRTALAASRFVPLHEAEERVVSRLLLEPGSSISHRCGQQISAALEKHAFFQAAAFPVSITTPRIHRYDQGMGRGDHVDPAFAGESPRMRCDIAATLCLSEPDDYQGGDLVVAEHGAPTRWRGNAGDCLLYPPDELHRVEPVTRGRCLVATTWIQSQVRDPRQRRILFDLANILEDVEDSASSSSSLERLRRGYFNLLRLWT